MNKLEKRMGEIEKKLKEVEERNKDLGLKQVFVSKEIEWLHFDMMAAGIKMNDTKDSELMDVSIDNNMSVDKNPIEFLEEIADGLQGMRARYISRGLITWSIRRALKHIKKSDSNSKISTNPSSKEIDYIKRIATKNAIWIDTAGIGLALADLLEYQGVPINRFTLLNQRALQQYLNGKEGAMV